MEESTANLDNTPADFIREIVANDVKSGKYNGQVVTRFPPEPNGYLHIGHAKAICLDFGIAQEFGGHCNLRMDDTNPTKEETEYVESIIHDVKWLGFDFGDNLFYASDYFDKMYECAIELIKRGKAYVCDLSADDWDLYRGNLTAPGKESPGRKRSIEENLDLFTRMKNGEFADGAMVLRAKIDMASPNIHMRDPAIYRIRRVDHFRQGSKWCIYPMYDYAHPLEDAFENVTHSLCTLEFEIHRPLYDWVLANLDFPTPPKQYEFSRLSLNYTVMSKRKLLQLVKEKYVSNWDDPRMPTICGMRRRGIPASAIRNFCKKIGITKFDGITEFALLEHCVREELNSSSPRYLAVLDPLKVTITNFPAGKIDYLDAVNNPEDPEAGSRKIAFTRELFIEKSDFMLEPPKGYYRLSPGKEVRLRYGYLLKCENVITGSDGEVKELECTIDLESRGGTAPDGRKVKGTIHWVSATEHCAGEIRLYDKLFAVEDPGANGSDFLTQLNPDSLKVVTGYLEKALADIKVGQNVQFERIGYFTPDPDGSKDRPVFNRTVTLKDSFKIK